MKKIYRLLTLSCSMLFIFSGAIAQCSKVTVEPFPLDPQGGSHNYFGVRVTLAHTFGQNVTVNGYIFDEGDPNTNNPFEVTVTASNLTNETAATFYQTSPTTNAAIDVTSISVCPYLEETIARYSTISETFSLNLGTGNQSLIEAFEEFFSVQDAVIDSIIIDDKDPTVIDSAAYAVFYVRGTNDSFAFGVYLDKESGTNEVIFKINDIQTSLARSWKCDPNGECNHCDGKRNGFLGKVIGCSCEECHFSTSGSGFPWAAIIGLVGTIIAALL